LVEDHTPFTLPLADKQDEWDCAAHIDARSFKVVSIMCPPLFPNVKPHPLAPLPPPSNTFPPAAKLEKLSPSRSAPKLKSGSFIYGREGKLCIVK